MRDGSAASGFLAQMAEVSRERVRAIERAFGATALLRCAAEAPAPIPFRLDLRFDVIAEVKLRAPSAGPLAEIDPASPGALAFVAERARAYAEGGALAISVLTEPTRFDGSLGHLHAAAHAVKIPVMRKDFIVDPLQIVEARASGASGVLLIARLLDDDMLAECFDAARSLGMFVLGEAFDAVDLARLGAVLARAGGPSVTHDTLIGLNARDLGTLDVDAGRLEWLAEAFPRGYPRVAESGLFGAADAEHVARLGYRAALVGTALMRASDPSAFLASLLHAGRQAAREVRG